MVMKTAQRKGTLVVTGPCRPGKVEIVCSKYLLTLPNDLQDQSFHPGI